MKKAIYKITNTVNGMMYIGATMRPEKRMKEHLHCRGGLYFYNAIKQYGANCFTFEVIGWFEDWKEKEKYYINYYNTLYPNGYNIHEGGGDPPAHYGEDNNNCSITKEVADAVKSELLDYSIPRREIWKKYNISMDLIRHLNEGNCWHDNSLSYPLRPFESILEEKIADKVKWYLQNTDLTQKQIANLVGWNRSAITMINIGKNHFDDSISYPIRSGRMKNNIA